MLIRQIQGQIAKQVHEERDSVSEYDSWSDLEDNFALAYEPIPLNIKLDTWRKMSKKEILRKVNSKKVRKDFEYLTHGEILDHIEKMQLNARYLSSKFGINHLMPHLENDLRIPDHEDHVKNYSREERDIQEELTETEAEDNLSLASFISGKEIYLSRADILNKIHKSKGMSGLENHPGVTRVNKSPVNGAVKTSRDNHTNGKLSPARKQPSRHDSWSSRASSILKDPEAIYVSRVELLKKISITDDSVPNRKSPVNKERRSATPTQSRQEKHQKREKRVHDSWSSRASSILAAAAMDMEEEQGRNSHQDEPPYMSRVELLKHLQTKSLEALSAASDKSQSPESDSDASTVKNGSGDQKKGQTRKWLSQKLQFEKDMISAIRDNYAGHNSTLNNDNNNNILNERSNSSKANKEGRQRHESKMQQGEREKQRSGNKSLEMKVSRDDETSEQVSGHAGAKDKRSIQEPGLGHTSDWDSCSCVTCNTCQLSDCSCSDYSESSNASKSSHSSDGSVETIVDAQERAVKHSDIYVINGSDVSKASSKGSSKSKLSKKSNNYDPLPLNGIDKIKQRKFTDEEIEKERRHEKEENIRRMSTNEKQSNKERRIRPKEIKGSIKSKGSWTNEEFAQLYEPVSADELIKKKQMKDLRQHLKSWNPELIKTVDKLNTGRRREVIKQLEAVVAHNIDLDNLSEEELGKHLDQALVNLNLGAMYVPMEKNPSNSKAVSRENTDYDTFGSIDSLIFEPKLPTHEDIAEAQEEITQSFEYLENEDDGQMEMDAATDGRHPSRHYNNNNNNNSNNILAKVMQFEKPASHLERRSPKHEKNALAVGQTTFAERVKLFQSLGGQERRDVTSDYKGMSGLEFEEIENQPAVSAVRRHDSPIIELPSHKREKPGLTQTTWKEQALVKTKTERSGRDSSASATSVSTNSSGSTVIYNVEVAESDEDEFVKKTSFKRRGSTVELPVSSTTKTVEMESVCSVCGECKSIVSEWSCSCYTYEEECSCVADCSECGNTETLQRGINMEDEEEPVRRSRNEVIISNHIPIVGNLRRVSRDAKEEKTMNIEKAREKKGYIIEDEEEKVPERAPSIESSNKMPLKLKEKLNRNESFQKLQKRNQFRSISPDVKHDSDSKPSYENYKQSGLLVEVEDGVPLIYKNEHLTIVSEEPDSKCLDASPKSKGSEMADSGISSNSASISPNSSSSGSSNSGQKNVETISEEEALDAVKKIVPPGKKRDTMIRELKTKLKERFPSDTIETQRNQRLSKNNNISSKSSTIKNAEVGPKLNKILTALRPEQGGLGGSRSSSRLLQPHYRNNSFSQDEELSEPEMTGTDTECDSSVYDPSLPPGQYCHLYLCICLFLLHAGLETQMRSPPPAPPPTAQGGKRGSLAITSPGASPSPGSKPSSRSSSRLSPLERREQIYGPGGVFGPTGPFSTPEISRYPEVTQTKRISFADMVDGKSDQSGFAEDRSDKSQYVSNPVITCQQPGRKPSPVSGTRVESYHDKRSGSAPASGQAQESGDAWVQEKQKRMLNWINRSQVALGAKLIGK